MDHKKDSYCSFCGRPFADNVVQSRTYPRVCGGDSHSGCGNITYNTPHIVSVVLVPTLSPGGQQGVLLVRRLHGATRGKLALPGGFVDGCPSDLERPQHCLQGQGALEVLEETGVTVSPSSLEHVCSVGPTESNTVLVFFQSPRIDEVSMPPFEPNDEVSERVITYGYRDLCFPTHSEMLRWFFAGQPDNIWDFSTVFHGYLD
jgi:ADP-ribose pyrophosphatase YjhB (NUDIX family)